MGNVLTIKTKKELRLISRYRTYLFFILLFLYIFVVQVLHFPALVGVFIYFITTCVVLFIRRFSNFKVLEMREDCLRFDGLTFSYEDLIYFKIENLYAKSVELSEVNILFKLKKNSRYYQYEGRLKEKNKQVRRQIIKESVDYIQQNVFKNNVTLDDINLMKGSEESGRFLILSALWSFYSLVALFSFFYMMAGEEYRYQDNTSLNQYFLIPLVISIIVGFGHYFILKKIDKPFYKLALITKIIKKRISLGISILCSMVAYFAGIQGLHYYNENYGERVEYNLNTIIVSDTERFYKSCYREKEFLAEEIKKTFSFRYRCTSNDKLVEGTRFSFRVVKGSLGMYYFPKKKKPRSES